MAGMDETEDRAQPSFNNGLVRRAISFALVAAVGFAAGLAVEAKGTIKSVAADKSEFVFADKDAKNWTFHMDKDGKVLINNKESKLADLQAGDEVTVIYEKKDDKLMASEVRCTRK